MDKVACLFGCAIGRLSPVLVTTVGRRRRRLSPRSPPRDHQQIAIVERMTLVGPPRSTDLSVTFVVARRAVLLTLLVVPEQQEAGEEQNAFRGRHTAVANGGSAGSSSSA